jgi:hypothetical protein
MGAAFAFGAGSALPFGAASLGGVCVVCLALGLLVPAFGAASPSGAASSCAGSRGAARGVGSTADSQLDGPCAGGARGAGCAVAAGARSGLALHGRAVGMVKRGAGLASLLGSWASSALVSTWGRLGAVARQLGSQAVRDVGALGTSALSSWGLGVHLGAQRVGAQLFGGLRH